MKLRKLAALGMSLCLGAALAACGGSSGGSSSGGSSGGGAAASGEKVVKIGVFEPQSGDNGAGGKQEILGMEYANVQTPTVEIGGETYKVQLEYADNASSNDKAPTAAQTLISNGVSVVLGSYGSGVSIAAGDTFLNAKMPAIGVTCTNPQVTAGCDVYFRICFLDPFQGTVLANYAKSIGATKAYCLAKQGDDYSGGLCNYFIDAFGKDNCIYEQFPEGTSDYSTYVTNAQNQGCDVFFSPVSTEAAAQIIAKAAAQNIVLDAAKDTGLEICVTTFYQEGADADFDKGIKDWINNTNTAKSNNGGNDELAAVTAMGYDAYYVALEALKKAGSTDPAKVLEVLPSVEYTGVTGAIAFDEVGDAKRDSAVVKKCHTMSGKWDFVTVAKAQ